MARLFTSFWIAAISLAGLVVLLTACAPAAASQATTAQIATLTPTPAPALPILATQTPRPISGAQSPSPAPIGAGGASEVSDGEAIMTPTPSSLATIEPMLTLGFSVENRPITAYRFGTGDRIVVLVGGIHGGWEANTVTLMDEFRAHFTTNPADLPASTSLVIIPALNPDGITRGRTVEGRFNANRVDLNRNWGCDWSPQAQWRDQLVSAGSAPMSEPETRALAAYLHRLRPAALLSFHSAANGVYRGTCAGDHGSALLTQIFGQAAPYPYQSTFAAYPVTGTLADWADGEGIAAADVELINSTNTDFERNLRGVRAVLNWLAER